jgi:hypothetical protein
MMPSPICVRSGALIVAGRRTLHFAREGRQAAISAKTKSHAALSGTSSVHDSSADIDDDIAQPPDGRRAVAATRRRRAGLTTVHSDSRSLRHQRRSLPAWTVAGVTALAILGLFAEIKCTALLPALLPY